MTPSVIYPPGGTFYNSYQHHNLSPSDAFYANYDYTGYLDQRPVYFPAYPFLQDPYFPNLRIMAAPTNPNEMEDFQRLSDNYRADLPGPLIGEKLPMSVLATEYAQADPTYVVKTAALAHKYSAYRNVKGDGQCGWRGTVFGYFETLLQLGDLEIVQQEKVRLQTFEDTMKMAGIDYDILTEMFDFTWDLFDKLEKAVERQDKDESILLDVLNDSVQSDSIVYHFKMMTSAFMQLHADDYEPFLEIPIHEYRVTRIDPTNQEIDQIGLQALTRAVIEPANIALEVLYLDRSMGEEVTPYPFVDNAAGKPTIRLLYRPGHYDMIYEGEQSLQIFFQKEILIPQSAMAFAQPSQLPPDMQACLFSSPEAMQSAHYGGSNSFYNTDQSTNHTGGLDRSQCLFSPHPQPSCLMPVLPSTSSYDISPAHAVMPMLNTEFPQTTAYHQPVQYPSPCSTDLTSSPVLSSPVRMTRPPPPPVARTPPSTTVPRKNVSGPQIRLNANCYNYSQRHESVPLCTQSYGSAATLSPAHFRNSDFQPHMWDADEEYYIKT